jgi:hypothetical protein
VAPAYLLVMLGGFCYTKVFDTVDATGGTTKGYVSTLGEDPDAQRAWLLILATIIGIVLITAVGSRRWRAQGMDLDGRQPAAD